MIRRNYGEGTFINVNDRYEWFGRYQDLDGKLRRKHIVAKDKKNLKAKVKEWLLMLDDRRHLKAKQDLTLEEWSNIWLRVRQGTAKDSTYQFYYSLVHNHIIPGLGVVRHINLGSIRHFKLVENNIKQFAQHINLCFFCTLF